MVFSPKKRGALAHQQQNGWVHLLAVFSFMIEFTQLLFHLGTFQISDLTYNTLGGAVGGVIYYLVYSREGERNKIRNGGQLSEH